jgi:K+-sensing histidine kinase KdpD
MERSLVERDIADIVRELKHPLAAIAVEAQIVETKLARDELLAGKRCVQRIARNVALLDRLLCDLLDATSFESGEFQLRKQTIELTSYLPRVLDRAARGYERRRIHIDAPCAVTLQLDPQRIERVLTTLLDNALEHSQPATPIIIRATGDTRGAAISVIANCVGLDAQELLEQRGSHGRVSHGLGLYVSKRIIEAHGGQMSAETIAGMGSRLFFDLPNT